MYRNAVVIRFLGDIEQDNPSVGRKEYNVFPLDYHIQDNFERIKMLFVTQNRSVCDNLLLFCFIFLLSKSLQFNSMNKT